MKIVIIDNIEWDGKSIADVDFKVDELAYCVSTFQQNIESIKQDIEVVKEILREENAHCYLINVHCITYRKNSKTDFTKEAAYQSQAGVNIYRLLLHLYKECPEKLRIVFFSPFSATPEQLIKKKPENIILNYLEFLEVPFTWKKVQTKFAQYNQNKHIFNNASENLLSGFALCKSQEPNDAKVSIGKKILLFIDDQSNEWSTVLHEIFQKGLIDDLSFSNQTEFREKLASGEFEKEVKRKLTKCHGILSDFYLSENHDPGKWMNKETIESISGFKLFHSIRASDMGKAIPYILHTSSNKIPYYKVFDQQGVDDWIVKDTRYCVPNQEKIDNYLLFKQTIERYLLIDENVYSNLQSLWLGIQEIVKGSKFWWVGENDYLLTFKVLRNGNVRSSQSSAYKKSDVKDILEASWYTIRRYLNREQSYEATLQNESSESFIAASICNNLGKIFEMLEISAGDNGFSYLTQFLLNVRHKASHHSDYKYFTLKDSILMLNLVIHALKYEDLQKFRDDYKEKKPGSNPFIRYYYYSFKKTKDHSLTPEKKFFPCGLLWIYIQFYNHECSKKDETLRKQLFDRINKIFKKSASDGSVKRFFDISNEIIDINAIGLTNQQNTEITINKETKKWIFLPNEQRERNDKPIFIKQPNTTTPTINEKHFGQYLKILIPDSW